VFTTTDENGIINNFASEPKMYLAETPSNKQQRSYVFQGIIGTLIIAASIFTAFVVS
jgi:hypothetical protein